MPTRARRYHAPTPCRLTLPHSTHTSPHHQTAHRTAEHQHTSADAPGLWQISYTQREGEAREPEGEGAAMVQQLARPRSQGVDAFLAASQIQLFKWVHSNYFWVLL